ncbi:MAG: amidohydrolase family protein [Dehalococcoidales bacterium]|nr:amidohydrolase family protein [Dehalococcoidales bacterium]
MKIDLHAHLIPRDCLDMTDKNGRKFGLTLGRDASGREVLASAGRPSSTTVAEMCDPEYRIQDMDKIGLDMQVISVAPTNIFYDFDAEEGLGFARRYNDGIAEVVRDYPDRFLGMATLPMQAVDKAVLEMERSVRELGLKAVEIISNINGKNLDEPEFWPFYEKAQEMGVLIYVHPMRVAGADRMKKYWLANLVGNPLDTTIAVASIIFGGILEKFPRLKFLFSHAGGYAPFIRGRWEHGYQYIDECRSIPRPPGEYFKQIYFDTIIHFGPALAYLVDTVGADKVVLGSDYPFAMGDPDPVATVRNAPGIPAADKELILERTSAALLGLDI